MKLTTYDHSVNYTCTVIELPVKQKVEGLDNLVRVEVFGNSCLVGKDSDPKDLYLFFPAESCLSEYFLKQNNLYRESQFNLDPTQKGFFETSGRVKTIKFKGVISSGFIIPVSSLIELFSFGDTHYVQSTLKAGDDFNEIDGVEVCRKYMNNAEKAQLGVTPKGDRQTKVNNAMKDLLVPNQLRFHADTTHLAKSLYVFTHNDIIVITDKWHGSSCILAKVLINKKLNWYQKLLNKLGGKVPTKEYGYIYSSGKPRSALPKGIVHEKEGDKYVNKNTDFYSSNIWKKAFDDHKHTLEDGITVYSELVGFTEGGSSIQKGYDYSCEPSQYKMVVYRITYTKLDGSVIEFSWQQIKDYCKKYELETVKELYFGKLSDFLISYMVDEADNMEKFFETLQKNFNMEKIDQYCRNKVPAEGMVVRIDGKHIYSAFKLKSKKFLAHETEELNSGEVNMEDQA